MNVQIGRSDDDEILDSWSLEEAYRINRDVLGDLRAGWMRDINESCNRPGFRGVIRQGRKIVWRSEHVSIWSTPEHALDHAIREHDRMKFDAWKAEKGIR